MSTKCSLSYNNPRMSFMHGNNKDLPYYHLYEEAGDDSGDVWLMFDDACIHIPCGVWNRIIKVGPRDAATPRGSEMDSELRECPNRECKSTDVEATYPDRGSSHVFCDVCGMRGPNAETVEEAEAAWNALPREPGPAVKAALDEVARLVQLKLSVSWGDGDGMIIRLARSQGEALLAELGETHEEASK